MGALVPAILLNAEMQPPRVGWWEYMDDGACVGFTWCGVHMQI